MPANAPSLLGRSRVLVVGCGGAGKTTVARRLGEVLDLPCVHLDVHYWRAGWRPNPGWTAELAELLARPRWVMDGSFVATLPRRLARADAAVFLDLPRLACFRGILVRWMRYRGRARDDMAPGCVESLDLPFLRWVWRYPAEDRPEVVRLLAAAAGEKPVVVLRSRRETERWLAALAAAREADLAAAKPTARSV